MATNFHPAQVPAHLFGTGAGINISVSENLQADRNLGLRLVGVAQCTADTYHPLPSVFHAVSVIVVDKGSYDLFSVPVVGDAVVFSDDVESVAGMVRGLFEFDVFENANLDPRPGSFWVSACLGPYLSPVINVDIR